jgi:hypothetical protein
MGSKLALDLDGEISTITGMLYLSMMVPAAAPLPSIELNQHVRRNNARRRVTDKPPPWCRPWSSPVARSTGVVHLRAAVVSHASMNLASIFYPRVATRSRASACRDDDRVQRGVWRPLCLGARAVVRRLARGRTSPRFLFARGLLANILRRRRVRSTDALYMP